ncbi:MAG: hypothetical protein KDB07_07005, partial [Planctomycetes bacterium]|nr:hypothetical protein [Planctomycetota bacterium]
MKYVVASVLALACAAALIVVEPATSQHVHAQANNDYDLKDDYNKTLGKLADLHFKIGRVWVKAKFETRAKDHFRRVVFIEPDNSKTWKALGYKEKDGKWIPGERD